MVARVIAVKIAAWWPWRRIGINRIGATTAGQVNASRKIDTVKKTQMGAKESCAFMSAILLTVAPRFSRLMCPRIFSI